MRRKTGTICILVGLLLIAAALGLTLHNRQESNLAGEAADAVMEKLIAAMPEQAKEAPQGQFMEFGPAPTPVPEESHVGNETGLMAMAVEGMQTVVIEDYRYIGLLEVPKLKISLPVMETWDYERLMTAPCRYTGNINSDDMVICAHNFERHFYPLLEAKPGMDVYFSTVDGHVYHYKVSNVEEIMPDEVEKMTDPALSGNWDLTLFTCYLGGASRCTVRCVRV